jgi:catechol 2,3-dioxygenase-like lactoylglutathione lyase family enzyme
MTTPAGSSGPILWITLSTADLDASVAVWESGLGLSVVERGTLSAQLASCFGDTALDDARWALLGGRTGGIRLIETTAAEADAAPLASLGWAAAEFSVIDADAAWERAVSCGFSPLGAPRALGSNPAIRAGQVAVPGGGAAYLTDIRAYDGQLDLYRAARPVDRAFIAVLASNDLDRDRSWLEAEGIGETVTDRRVEVPVLQDSLGLSPGEATRISSVQLAGGCLIELDAYPQDTPPRACSGGWPAGVAMVALASPALPGALRCDDAPYDGRLAQVDRLPSGALLERVGP